MAVGRLLAVNMQDLSAEQKASQREVGTGVGRGGG